MIRLPARSLATTVAARVALTVLLTLLAGSVLAYIDLSRLISDQLDKALRSAAALAFAAVAERGTVPSQHYAGSTADYVAEVNRFVILRDRNGHTRSANVPGLSNWIPADPRKTASAPVGQPAFETLDEGSYGPVRSLTVLAPGDSGMTLQVAASLRPLAQRLDRLRWQLITGSLAITLLALLGALLLAREVCRPVTEIAEAAGGLDVGTLGQRLQVRGRTREANELVDVLNDMLTRLDRAFDWQRRLLGNLGHDIRTPMTVLRGNTEMALFRERSPEQYRSVLAENLEEIDRLVLISDALILLARYEAGTLIPRPEPLDLSVLARDAVGRIPARAAGGVETVLPESMAVQADRRMLQLQFEELVRNAVQHTPPGTRIRVEAEADGDWARYRVEDAGPGVPEQAAARLFELGFRSDPARGRAGAAGLGLTVCAAIARVHGGSIVAGRSSMGGLRVEVSLPRVPRVGPPAQQDYT